MTTKIAPPWAIIESMITQLTKAMNEALDCFPDRDRENLQSWADFVTLLDELENLYDEYGHRLVGSGK
jgi:hypothetical protein